MHDHGLESWMMKHHCKEPCSDDVRLFSGQDSGSILALKQQLKLMEQEVTKLRRRQQAVITKVTSWPAASAVATTASLADSSSVAIHNVHFSATPQIVAAHFSGYACIISMCMHALQDAVLSVLHEHMHQQSA